MRRVHRWLPEESTEHVQIAGCTCRLFRVVNSAMRRFFDAVQTAASRRPKKALSMK